MEADNTRNGPAGLVDMKHLRDAIPSRCFKPSTVTSLSYLFRDILMSLALIFLSRAIPRLSSNEAAFCAWMLYGFLQGLVLTGLWVIGHECGHGAFSKYPALNNTVGWAIHSILLVPFFAWKFSHAQHHRYTAHIRKDTVFVPTRKSGSGSHWNVFEDCPLYNLGFLILRQLTGWPLYLCLNVSAGSDSSKQNGTYGRWWRVNHFHPASPIFQTKEAGWILLSDLGVALMLGSIYIGTRSFGCPTMVYLYLVPYLWVNHWLVAITYLQHTHPSLLYYEGQDWTFTKGALSTVDRDLGIVGRWLFHGIAETHVVHHLFPKIPFYHAGMATEAVMPLLGEHYKRDTAPFLKELWTTFNRCKWIEPGREETAAGVLSWNK